jgi:H+/gluconate symporter-like permease
MTLSVLGILLSLVVIVVLALRGVGIMLIAPLAVVIVSFFSEMGVLDTLMGPYMKGFVNYASKFYLVFLFASVFGKYMDDSGAAKSIARGILSVIGHEKPLYVLLAVAAITLALTLGGVSLFVVIFAVMPIARPLFKQMDIPWHLFIAAFIFGIGSISMTMMPGSPSILNIMPMKYLKTTATAAPLLGIIASLLIAAFNVYYMKYQLKKSRDRGEGYEQSEVAVTTVVPTATVAQDSLPKVWLSVIPSLALIAALNVLKIDIVWSLVIGCAVAQLCFWQYIDKPMATLNAGATNTALPVINTCADVGYGMAVAASAGFKVITDFLMSIPGHPVISLSLATFLMTAITGSASGGMGIVLETLISKYVAMGVNPELLHRVISISAGTFDAMPHNGVIITTLAVAGLTHKQAYRHVWWSHCVATFLVMIAVIGLGIILY